MPKMNKSDPKLNTKSGNFLVNAPAKLYSSSDLFGKSSSVAINHRGALYTLRITQLGKLILTK